MKEYSQLDDRTIFDPMNVKDLSHQEKANALNLITMVKEKRCGKIKGRACADGRKQRKYHYLSMDSFSLYLSIMQYRTGLG
jgi:hypothetical protein